MATLRYGRYEALRLIASGGMGSVYQGRVVGVGGFQRMVAIKVMHEHVATDPEFRNMFLDEARLAACIHHPNCVSTLDVQDGPEGLFLVMEYVKGASLDRLITVLREQEGTILPLPVTLQIMRDVLTGLHAAHDLTQYGSPLNVVHRDVSPQNILVGVDGIARITDFGIAKAEARITSTRGDKVKGKLAYMAVEQLRNLEVDRRVDVYAAGVVLWEMLTGQRLFVGESQSDIVMAVLAGPQKTARDVNREVPPSVDAACMRALRAKEERYHNAEEFARALTRAASEAAINFPAPSAIGALAKQAASDLHSSAQSDAAALDGARAALESELATQVYAGNRAAAAAAPPGPPPGDMFGVDRHQSDGAEDSARTSQNTADRPSRPRTRERDPGACAGRQSFAQYRRDGGSARAGGARHHRRRLRGLPFDRCAGDGRDRTAGDRPGVTAGTAMRIERLVLGLSLAVGACQPRPVRGEVVLIIDTDAEVPRHVDSLRVEVFELETRRLLEARELTLATKDRWPVSFSVAAAELDRTPRFRVRLTAFRSDLQENSKVVDDEPASTLTPPACSDGHPLAGQAPAPLAMVSESAFHRPLPQHAISRWVDVSTDDGQVRGARVVLRLSCIASRPPAIDDSVTCIDGASAASSAGVVSVEPDALPATAIGTSPLLSRADCAAHASDGPEGRACIRGGFMHLGDARSVEYADCPACANTPAVPVLVESFLMDRYEVTVGRYHDATTHADPSKRFTPSRQPRAKSGNGTACKDSSSPSICTWPGAGVVPDAAARLRSLNCVSWRLADEFCRWAGGSLPSEAQWHFAASGRGKRFTYPWGNEPPTNLATATQLVVCPDRDLAALPPAIDVPNDEYDFTRDTTPDGVSGLFGLLAEITADAPGALSRPGCRRASARGFGRRSYAGPIADDRPCACAGLVSDPEIESGKVRVNTRVIRGADYSIPTPSIVMRRRLHAVDDSTLDETSVGIGFRCVYPLPKAP
jgi:formylglycine-generating enzyme required for sulfatase activity